MGKKLTVYMIDGTEYGPRLSEIGNWVGKAIYSPRSSVNRIINREEFDNAGIYCLKGDPENSAYDEKIYIGEAENVKIRLQKHLSNPKRDFKELIFFISKDELLTKTQIKYLESRLIQIALEAKTAQIDNVNRPVLPTLHEADISDMEYFLEQVKLILPLMGFKFLIPSSISTKKSRSTDEIHNIYYIKTKTFKATMHETNQGYIVLKGSEAKKSLSKSCTETYRTLRRKLLETGIMIEKERSLIFNEDAIFNSASAASNMVLGRNSNGYTEWVTKEGLTFKDVQENITNKSVKTSTYQFSSIRKKYKNAYFPWSITNDERLKKMYLEERSLKELIKEFGRSRGSILSRLKKIGLVSNKKQAFEKS